MRVYVANSESQDISVFALDDGGELLALATVPIQSPAHPGRSSLLAFSPDAKFLYASFQTAAASCAVASYAIDSVNGVPRRIGTTGLADFMAYIATDRSGRYLLGASYSGGKIAVNAIGADGVVGATLQVIATEPKAHCILADAANRHVLTTSLGGDLVYQHRFDPASGMLAPNEPPTVKITPKAGPRFLNFAPGGRFVYLLNELDGSIDVFPYDAARGTLGGRIQATSSLPPGFAGTAWAADIRLTPDGAYLYATERTSSTIAAFAVDRAGGTLRPLASHPTVKQPRSFFIDPKGRYLIAAGQLSHSIQCHRIDAGSGALTALREYPVGRNPTWVEIIGPPGV